MISTRVLTPAVWVLVLVCAASPALAATKGTRNGGTAPNVLPPPNPVAPFVFIPASQTVPPPGFFVNARTALRIADGTKAVHDERRKHPDMVGHAYISPLGLPHAEIYHWDVLYRSHGKYVAEVELDGQTGLIYLTQVEPDVGWALLRGYPGVLGHKLNAPYIWLPLCLLFLVPFFDLRRPFRLLHLDLAMMLGFGISHYYFNLGKPATSVPLVYPFLVYFVARMIWAGFRPKRRAGELIPHFGTRAVVIGLAVLVAFRIGFGVLGSGFSDVSAAGVVGADRIEHGLQLYVDNDTHGDTYGPVNYLMYIPAELAFPYHPNSGVKSAARTAALEFDLLMLLGLFLLGRRLRPGETGRRMGVALAYAWAAYPYSALVIGSTTNDTLAPLFLVYALLVITSPPARGAFTALASLTKFAPAIVAPMLIVGRGPFRWRSVLIAGGVFALVCAALIYAFLPDGGLREFWNTTLGFQFKRKSPLSIWVRDPGLHWLRPLTEAFAVGLALVATFFPRRRTVGQLAALCAATLAAMQIPTNYWIYFYLAWIAPFILIALFEEHRTLGPAPAEDQGRVVSALLKPVRISQPESVTTTRSSIRTPSLPGR